MATTHRGTTSPGTENGARGNRQQADLDELWAACSGLLQAAGKQTSEGDGADSSSVLANVGTMDPQVSKADLGGESGASSAVEFLSPRQQNAAEPCFSELPGNAPAWLESASGEHLLEHTNRESSNGNFGFFASFQVTPALEHASTNLDQAPNLPSPTGVASGVASSNVSPAYAHRRRASGTWQTHLSEGDPLVHHHKRTSTSDTFSMAGTASPNRPNNSNQPFMGFPQAWGNMKRSRSGSASDLPLSTRAGDSNTPRLLNGLDAASRQAGVCGASSLHQSDSRAALQVFFDSEALDAEESSEQGHVKLRALAPAPCVLPHWSC
jgi:hypothetical protein